MAIDKLVPRYLNKDDDPRVLKSIELVDALNVRISNNDDGNAGVIKNVKGNTVVAYKNSSDTLPAGDNKVIGTVTNLQKDEVFYFVYNSNRDHCIYKYNVSNDNVIKVYQDNVLDFTANGFVKADVIVNQYNDTLLYFTDGVTAPKKINISKAERGGYPADYSQGTNASTTLTDEERLLFITTAKQPPLDPPTWSFFTDTTKTVNNLYEKTFQFAYQYVYEDGEVSAISPYSSVAYTLDQLNDGLVSEDAKKNNNGITVSVKTNIGDVKKIRVLGRSGLTGVFFIIDEIDNDRTGVYTKTTNFFNDGSFSAITTDEVNKLFDNVPLKADSQAISGNRLMYAGYTEGYDNVDVDIEVLSNYKNRAESYDTAMTLSTDNNSVAKTIEIDLSDIPETLAAGSVYTLDLSIISDYVKFDLQNYPMSWTEAQRGSSILRGRIKDTVNVDMTPIKKSFIYSPTSAKSKADAATAIMGYLSTNIAVAFDTVDQFLDHATEIYNVVNGGADTKRFAFYRGDGTVRFQNRTYDSTTEKITAEIQITEATLTLDKLYGSASGSPDYTDRRWVEDRGYGGSAYEPATSIDISYGGDYSNYTGYLATLYGDPALYFYYLATSETANSRFQNAKLSNNSRLVEGLSGSLSFKAGATHSLGVVYYDDRNRSGSVQKAPEAYVKWFGERAKKGPTSMVMRLKHNPPSWATRWSPVYTGNTTTSDFIQYSVIEARTETNTEALKSAGQDYNNKIFVSMRSLSGKEDSYKESKGALIDYSFTQGDKLRVVSFGDNYYPDGVEFNVVGYEYLTGSPTDNPLYDDTSDATKYKTTGYYLILEDNGHSKFGKAAVVAGTDDWDNKCVVEIYSKRKTTDGLPFYEIGKSYGITSGSHDGDRTDTSVSFNIQGTGSWRGFRSSKKVFKGDIFYDNDVKIKVFNVEQSDDTSYEYKGDCQVLTGNPSGTYTLTVDNPDCVVEIEDGDVYFRFRQLRYGKDHTTYNYMTEFIEDESVSDFFVSNQNSFGRSNLYSPNTMQMERKASITYSEKFNYDSSELRLSSFNLSLANFNDFDNSYGSIKYIQNSADSLICLQQNKMSVIPVGRNIIEYASDNADLVASNNILGTPQYMAGDYGCDDNPESVVIRFGRIYFADIRAGKVLAFGASGIEPISEKGMDSFFTKKFADATKYSSAVDLNSGFDPDNDEYIISINDIYNSTVVATDAGGSTTTTLSTNSNGDITTSPVFGSEYFQYQNTDIDWEDVFSLYEDAGNGVIYMDRNDLGNVQLDVALSEYATGTQNIIATTTQNDFVGQASINLANGLVTLIDGEGTTFSTSGTTKQFEGFTAAYDVKSAQWVTLYSFVPEKMGFIKNQFFSFKDGRIYAHETNSTHNSFYGTTYASKISVVSNQNPSMVKTYETISLEGNAAWDATFKNSDQQSTITASAFDQRERNYYAHIGRDTLGSTGHIVAIGEVESISGDKMVLTSRVSNIAIPYEANILKVSGSTLVDTNLDVNAITGRKEIQADATVTGISVGDVLVASSPSAMDGDPMRDYYLQIDLEKTSSTAIELYAVNANFDKSNLHDQQGQ